MKKLILFFLFAALNMSAQSTTYFKKPLELETVPLSISTSDSIMVIGADKIVRHIPRSEFSSGGSQNLQQTLDNGGYAEFNSSNQNIDIFSNGSEYFTVNSKDSGNELNYSSFNVTSNGISLESNNSSTIGTNIIEIDNGQIKMRQRGTTGSRTDLSFNDPIFNTNLKFPAKPSGGTYTLATLDDIVGVDSGLQTVLNNGSTGVLNNVSIHMESNDGELDTKNTFININKENIRLQGRGGTNILGEIRIEEGIPYINVMNNSEGGKITNVTFADPNTVTNLLFPSKPSDGVYTIATLDDISGGSQDLQSVLDNGNTATGNINITESFNKSFISPYTIFTQETSEFGRTTSVDPFTLQFSKFKSGDDFGNVVVLYPPDEISTAPDGMAINYKLPYKPNGDYTLATLADLPLMVKENAAPTSATATGIAGDIRIDSDYVYICTATNTWKRSPLTTW